jgi:hypothetical protein
MVTGFGLTKQNSSVFNQLPQSRLERVFGRRSALFPIVKETRCLKNTKKMTLYVNTPLPVND